MIQPPKKSTTESKKKNTKETKETLKEKSVQEQDVASPFKTTEDVNTAAKILKFNEARSIASTNTDCVDLIETSCPDVVGNVQQIVTVGSYSKLADINNTAFDLAFEEN